MSKVPGITYIKGGRYVLIDLRIHGANRLLEDFLDIQEAEACRDEPTVPWSEVVAKLKKRHKL